MYKIYNSGRIGLVLMGFSFFLSFNLAYASVIINEVMYDLDGADIDWVEVKNNGSEEINLTTLKLLIGSVGSNHGIVEYSGGASLGPGEYGVIVVTSVITKYISKWGNSGIIFTSSFSLPNTTARVDINDGDKNSPLSSVSYSSDMGAAGDGNSLQLISGSWQAAVPTPGEENQASLSLNSDDEDNSTDDSVAKKTVTETKSTSVSKIKAQITTKTLAYAGIPLAFSGGAFGLNGEKLFHGRYFWNFGDGDFRETKVINADKFTHTYFYPGEYTVLFEYYPNHFAEVPDAYEKITIKVVVPEVLISNVGDEKDFFVELSNNTTYDADISNWLLVSEQKSFTIPRNTILAAKKKMVITSRITGFSISDKDSLKLLTSEGSSSFDYGASIASVSNPIQPLQTSPYQGRVVVSPDKGESKGVPVNSQSETRDEPVLTQDLEASVASSGAEYSPLRSYVSSLVLTVFLGASAGAVYFIRRKKISPNAGEDFEILDE